MTEFIPTVADVEAAGDVIDDITNLSDSLPVDQAVDFRAAADQLLAKVKAAIDMLDAHLVKVLESPQVRDGKMYAVKTRKEKTVFDHDAIAHYVRVLAQVDAETGEFREAAHAVEEATRLMSDIYLSPSTAAKVGQLDRYQIPRDKVSDIQWGRKYIKVTPATGAAP